MSAAWQLLLRSALLVRSVVGATVRLYKHHLTEEYVNPVQTEGASIHQLGALVDKDGQSDETLDIVVAQVAAEIKAKTAQADVAVAQLRDALQRRQPDAHYDETSELARCSSAHPLAPA